MKPSFRDYLTILLAFMTVFACGFGVGHLVGEKKAPLAEAAPPAWEQQSLALLVNSLDLSAEERQIAENEIKSTADAIGRTRDQTIHTYHEHLSKLYQRLIDRLGETNASRLRQEKNALDAKIKAFQQKT